MHDSDNDRETTLTVAQVAARFQVHTTTIQRWIKKQYFPGARKRGLELNSAYLVPIADIEALEEKLQVVAVVDDQPDPPSHQPPTADDSDTVISS